MKETREQASRRVFEDWRARQHRPQLNTYSKQRAKQISSALAAGYTADDLILLIRWAYESPEDRPRFLRGENDQGKTYLDLTNLLVISKLDQRITWAREWAERLEEAQPEPEADQLRLVANGSPLPASPAARPPESKGGRWSALRGKL